MKIRQSTTALCFVVATLAARQSASLDLQQATFAGGCFWCIEAPFDKLEGVHSAISGYTGGVEKDPTYRQVSGGSTGHIESVQVTFDPGKVTYQQLLDVYWRQFDPTDAGGSFYDRGHQYTSAVFYHDENQRQLAAASKAALGASGRFDKPIVTLVRPLTAFYPAEEYHQDYHVKSAGHYQRYRRGSDRDRFIEAVWGKPEKDQSANGRYSSPSREELRQKLTKLQFEVTQEDGTEPSFRNEFWDNVREGIYVDVVSGEPLFSSTHKYKSGTGWPSFWQPLEPENIVDKTDAQWWATRTEVRSVHGDSHLGHLFDDGPEPTGLRYCINSASLRFIPKSDLENEGFGKYALLFK